MKRGDCVDTGPGVLILMKGAPSCDALDLVDNCWKDCVLLM